MNAKPESPSSLPRIPPHFVSTAYVKITNKDKHKQTRGDWLSAVLIKLSDEKKSVNTF